MKTPQFAHQKTGTAALVAHKAFALFDEMGAGKSKQVIDAACTLAEQGKIDTVVIVAPASVRCVWIDKEIGEIKKHSWHKFNMVMEFHGQRKMIWGDDLNYYNHSGLNKHNLFWIVTNYEFLRSSARIEEFIDLLRDRRVLLVLDESSYIKNRTAKQSKAVAKLRANCDRCVILNGTPITQSPLDLWSQIKILDPKILKCFNGNFYHFRAEYAEMRQQRFGGHSFAQVVRYKNLDKLTTKLAPYVLRREKKDCLDLPPKLYTEREVALTPASWKRYQELKKDFIMTLCEGDVRLEPNAAVRAMRLAQLTSGHLGCSSAQFGYRDKRVGSQIEGMELNTQDLSDEKLKWCVQYLTEECTAKAVIVWTRWRRERERLYGKLVNEAEPKGWGISQLYGGQSKKERNVSALLFSTTKKEPGLDRKQILIAQQHAGGYGLNLVAASEAIYLSNDFSLGIRLQSEDRCHRPGQVNPVTYIDVLATGPQGQKTIDSIIFKALREKKNIADMTTAQWRKELSND